MEKNELLLHSPVLSRTRKQTPARATHTAQPHCLAALLLLLLQLLLLEEVFVVQPGQLVPAGGVQVAVGGGCHQVEARVEVGVWVGVVAQQQHVL